MAEAEPARAGRSLPRSESVRYLDSTPLRIAPELRRPEPAPGRGLERGLARLRVRSNVIRERAHRFYERVGFEKIKAQAVFEKSLPGRAKAEGDDGGRTR